MSCNFCSSKVTVEKMGVLSNWWMRVRCVSQGPLGGGPMRVDGALVGDPQLQEFFIHMKQQIQQKVC